MSESQSIPEKKRQYQREYMRRYRKDKPDIVKNANLNYWKRKVERENKLNEGEESNNESSSEPN